MKINVLHYRDVIRESYSCGAGFWEVNVEARQEVEVRDDQYIAVHQRIDFVDKFGSRERLPPSIDYEVRHGKYITYYPLVVRPEPGPWPLAKCVSLIVSDTSFQVIVDEMIHGPLFATPEAEIRSYIAESYKPEDFVDEGHVHRYYKMPPMNILRPFLVAA